MRRWLGTLLFALAGTLGLVSGTCAQRVLLVPVDDRPATGQFAQMIGDIAGAEVRFPPYNYLGRFTNPGQPEDILAWLETQDLSQVDALVVSTDMIAYGGLIASRENRTDTGTALTRLRRLANLRRQNPSMRLLAFTSLTRLAPTATRAASGWRMELARFVEMRDQARRTGDRRLQARLAALRVRLPKGSVERYDRIRARNYAVQRELVEMTARQQFDYLLVGQDDAARFGPHIGEREKLRALVAAREAQARVVFAEGIDQHACVLVSRVLLRMEGFQPAVRIVWSDPAGRARIADYESKPLERSVLEQLFASGARPAQAWEAPDYTLFVNVPNPSEGILQAFLSQLVATVDAGAPVAVADVNIAKNGTADPRLFAVLTQDQRVTRALAYAGWNTAGNTIGTSIPAANVYLLARRSAEVDPVRRELAKRTFLLHRLVNDFEYHSFTRPAAYRLIDALPGATREETYGEAFEAVDSFVRRDLRRRLEATFSEEFQGQEFVAGDLTYRLTSLEGVRIFLPWPRAYEVRLEFQLGAEPVLAARKR